MSQTVIIEPNADLPLNDLLQRLHDGDSDAVAELFRTYEPYLHMVVRRRLSAELRIKFDSDDVVQSTWADLLEGFRGQVRQFADANHLRAFLVRATVNRFIDQTRKHLRQLHVEQPLVPDYDEGAPVSSVPSPGEQAEAAELWDRLMKMCPPAHAEILRMRRDGAPLAEIAAVTGYHGSSVRRIIYDLDRRVTQSEF